MPIFVYHHPPVQSAGHAVPKLVPLAVAQQDGSLDSDLLHPPQPSNDPLFIQNGIRISDTAEEVTFKILHG